MTPRQRDRYDAAHLLALAASNGNATLTDIATAAGIDVTRRPAPLRLARRALSSSVGAGNWREARAEAEARLRCTRRRR